MHVVARSRRKGVSLVELGVATFIVTVVALAGVAYYANARSQEIREWHEQNALFMAEREVESWRGSGYNALAGWTAADTGPTNFLPYGYSFIDPDPDWDQGGKFKPVTLDGFDYRIRARMLFNDPVGAAVDDYRVHEVWDNGTGDVDYWYRQIVIVVQWGDFSSAAGTLEMTQETRIAR